MPIKRTCLLPHVQTDDFDGFGENWCPDSPLAFEICWMLYESELREVVRRRGFVVLHTPVTNLKYREEMRWQSGESFLYTELAYHSDASQNTNLVLLTQAPGKEPREPGTIIAPAGEVEAALQDEKIYTGWFRQQILSNFKSQASKRRLSEFLYLHSTSPSHGNFAVAGEIFALEREVSASLERRIYRHSWKDTSGCVLLIDNSAPPIRTLHARLFEHHGQELVGHLYFATMK